MDSKSATKALLIVVVCLFLAACSAEPDLPEAATDVPATAEIKPGPTAVPEPAPMFMLNTLDGAEVSLSDYRGEWVILNFWATWCPPCVSEMPYLQTLADRDLNVLGVNMAEEAAEVELFTVQHGIKFPILMNPDVNTILDYQARQLPRTVIVAPDGTIALRIAGPIAGEQLDPWLDEHGVN